MQVFKRRKGEVNRCESVEINEQILINPSVNKAPFIASKIDQKKVSFKKLKLTQAI